jgi:3-oxoacyl-[acyl-carrier-protein] synthase III
MFEVVGHAYHVPDRVIYNDYFSEQLGLDTSVEWIFNKTGIKERRYSESHVGSSDLAVTAAKSAAATFDIDLNDIGVIIVSTVTPDYLTPCTAIVIQQKLGLDAPICFDINNACPGFIFALDVASKMLDSVPGKLGLVIGADVGSKVVDFSSRANCYFFGDGAGAFIIKKGERPTLRSVVYETIGKAEVLNIPGGGFQNQNPGLNKTVYMEGAMVKEFAISSFVNQLAMACQAASIDTTDLDQVVPHQANMRIIEAGTKALNLNANKVFTIIEKYGNCMSASLPIALSCYLSQRIDKTENIGMVGFGAGLVSAGAVMRI